MKFSALAILAGVLALSIMPVPAYAVDHSARSLTVATTAQSISCSDPIDASGTASGNNILRRPVKLTVTDVQTGQIVAYGHARVSNGTYSTTLSITSTTMGEGRFTVTATWYSQVAVTENSFDWAC